MRRIVAFGEETVCTSIVIAAEMRFGAKKMESSTLAAKVEQILDNIEVLPLDIDADGITLKSEMIWRDEA